ncbi:MAG: DUF3683 domain-containing protein [Magnetococcales bacterium]|nr:DUF3683 domain-containing protein [Magnetococcales bacterium]
MSESAQAHLREIPYNYTSFSDREIVQRFLGVDMWKLLETLATQRRTGQSQRMLFEILGDLWIVDRNPILQEELLVNDKRLKAFMADSFRRVLAIEERSRDLPQVGILLVRVRAALEKMAKEIREFRELRQRLAQLVGQQSPSTHLDFSVIARVASVTDATDWRVEYPFVVITAHREEEWPTIVAICNQLEITMIARGGGTGYTGAGVPLFSRTAILNMERLNAIGPVRHLTLPGTTVQAATIRVEAGAVTHHVALAAQREGLVFAVDPTSKQASTIGGNIAMNAGGKKAVLWGTTLDNLVSWTMVTPDGHWLLVERLGHNQGKIHDQPVARFRLLRWQPGHSRDQAGEELLEIPVSLIRKPGLGKDVTNKALGGLPGVQKEGCDGVITSAVFLLHPGFQHIRTVCLEFFGMELGKAVPAIVEIKDYLDRHPRVGCAGLEHMDARYIKAVDYNTKSARNERPRMVLLADIVGEEEQTVLEASQKVVSLARERDGEGFIAASPEDRQRFWADRSRTAAIAKHTNAFKINEDIVIPLAKLAEYNHGVERINIEQSLKNKIAILDEFVSLVIEMQSSGDRTPSLEGQRIITDKQQAALGLLQEVRQRWQTLLMHLDTPAHDPVLAQVIPVPASEDALREPLIQWLLRGAIAPSFRKEVREPLRDLFSGEHWQSLQSRLDDVHKQGRARRIFIALHMHAGDGNVHTNIPVNSNDYDMLREAERIVDHLMTLAVQLGGKISGEHGIGMTKFAHLEPAEVDQFVRYKQQVDPFHRFNKGKLLPVGMFFAEPVMERAYTPSLRLVQQEAIILEESAMGGLNDAIRHCLRCGKCKEVCTTHVPESGLFYSPRNKILALGLAIEAYLYEEQTRRGLSVQNLTQFVDLADHCAVCHRCQVPCPVHIDFGLVTVAMRGIPARRRLSLLPQRLALAFLTTQHPGIIRFFRRYLLIPAYKAQRTAHWLVNRSPALRKLLTWSARRPWIKPRVAALTGMLHSRLPLPSAGGSARTLLGWDDKPGIPWVPVVSRPDHTLETVFYFPGCGCERLFSDIALATLALIHHLGIQTVLPPTYMCCGFPQKGGGDAARSRRMSLENRVLLHRVANTVDFLQIKTVLVSCGTCLSQLQSYHLASIFPGCRVMDIHEFLFERGIRTQSQVEETLLFHDPCHSPMTHHAPARVVAALTGSEVRLTDRCCSEAGTFALAHPETANRSRLGKKGVMERAAADGGRSRPCRIMTSCPSCYQGLSRIGHALDMETDFLAVHLAARVLGDSWQQDFLRKIQSQKVDPILFN